MIRPARTSDSASICAIYNFYIETSAITFEETPIDVSEMESRMTLIKNDFPFVVYEDAHEVIGYAYLNYFRPRSAYRFTLEDSIYIRSDRHGRGAGKQLLGCLLDAAPSLGIHAIIAGITIPNEKSIRLHESFGFRNAGILREAGNKFGHWHDVGYWELITEKR